MILLQESNLRFTGFLLASPSSQAAASLTKLKPFRGDVEQLMRYQAAEQNRRYASVWEESQIGLAVVLGACLFFATQRRVFPILFCGLMLLMVIFEHFGISPELAFRGRETDFGDVSEGAKTGVWALDQVYKWVEGSKLMLGSLLAGYLFIFRTVSVRRRSRTGSSLQHTPAD